MSHAIEADPLNDATMEVRDRFTRGNVEITHLMLGQRAIISLMNKQSGAHDAFELPHPSEVKMRSFDPVRNEFVERDGFDVNRQHPLVD